MLSNEEKSEIIEKLKEILLVELRKEILDKDSDRIPVSIFSRKLSCLEAIVKYLKENLKWSNRKIAKELNRSVKTVWATYSKAEEKMFEKINVKETEYFVKIKDFSGRKLSVLETIVWNLKEKYDLSFHEIAELLERNDRTIWATYQKAKRKLKV